MKKIIFWSIIAMMAFCNCSPVRATVEKKLDQVIMQQQITVTNNTQKNLDSLGKLATQLRTDSVSMGDLHPMQPGSNWFKNNWEWLLSVLIFLMEFFLRIAPTNKDWSIVNKILSILIWIFNMIPNNAKVRESVLKRGHDLKVKKIVEAYRNK